MNFEKKVSIYRGDIEESIHFAAAAVVNSAGDLIHCVGNPELITFPRSSLKFIQAVALVETGAAQAYKLGQRHLSLACASHSGEQIHIDLVNEWLHQLGLNENNLSCGTDYPMGKEALFTALRRGNDPRRSFHNCSGKHTGFLTVCKHLQFPIENYHLLNHPVQQLFIQNLSHFAELDANQLNWGVDGCGFPAPSMKLEQTAYAMARFADPSTLPKSMCSAVISLQNAVAKYPQYMSGATDLATRIVNATQGAVLIKIGAEGFFTAVVPARKLGIALKIADGSVRGAEYAIVDLLSELDLFDEQARQLLIRQLSHKILNSRDEKVGRITTPNWATRESVQKFE